MSEHNIIDLVAYWLEDNKFPMTLTEKDKDYLYYNGAGFYWFYATYDIYSKCITFLLGTEIDDELDLSGLEDELSVKIYDPNLFDKLETFILPSI